MDGRGGGCVPWTACLCRGVLQPFRPLCCAMPPPPPPGGRRGVVGPGAAPWARPLASNAHRPPLCPPPGRRTPATRGPCSNRWRGCRWTGTPRDSWRRPRCRGWPSLWRRVRTRWRGSPTKTARCLPHGTRTTRQSAPPPPRPGMHRKGGGGTPPPPFQGPQPMPCHCPPDANCQPQWHS